MMFQRWRVFVRVGCQPINVSSVRSHRGAFRNLRPSESYWQALSSSSNQMVYKIEKLFSDIVFSGVSEHMSTILFSVKNVI